MNGRTGDGRAGGGAARAARWPGAVVALFVLALAAGILFYVFAAGEMAGAGSEGQTDARNVAAGCVPTESDPGGTTGYMPDAPVDGDLGDGLVMSGTVREAGTCEPVEDARVQVWLATAEGGEYDSDNRGSVLTDGRGRYRIETYPVVPLYGEPNVHVAYDDGEYEAVFRRLVIDEDDADLVTDFVLEPNG